MLFRSVSQSRYTRSNMERTNSPVISQEIEQVDEDRLLLLLRQARRDSDLLLRCNESLEEFEDGGDESEESTEEDVEELAQGMEDNFYRHFVGMGLYYDWANGYINRAVGNDVFKDYFEKNSPFIATAEEIEEFEKEARITRENLGLIDCVSVRDESIVDFGFRRLNTELVEVPSYVPFEHRRMAGFQSRKGLKHESWDCLCRSTWDDFLVDIQRHDLDKSIDNWLNHIIS